MKILNAKEVSKRTSFSVSHLRRLSKEDKFPKPVQLSEHRSGWLEEDVENWIGECVRKNEKGTLL